MSNRVIDLEVYHALPYNRSNRVIEFMSFTMLYLIIRNIVRQGTHNGGGAKRRRRRCMHTTKAASCLLSKTVESPAMKDNHLTQISL